MSEPPHAAAALTYDPSRDEAPRVVAAGRGYVAERIVALARAHDVPIHSDPDLAAALAALGADELIPPELYGAVAAVLAFVASVDARAAAKWSQKTG